MAYVDELHTVSLVRPGCVIHVGCALLNDDDSIGIDGLRKLAEREGEGAAEAFDRAFEAVETIPGNYASADVEFADGAIRVERSLTPTGDLDLAA